MKLYWSAGEAILVGAATYIDCFRDLYRFTRTSFVFNATNLNRDLRSKWLPMFADYGARVHLIYLEVPYTQLLSQNRNREHSVPNDVIHRMINKLEIPDYSEAHMVDFVVSG